MLKHLSLGNNISLRKKTDHCYLFSVQNANGNGTMTMHELFPGVVLMYNDFHMSSYESDFITDMDLFCIDHCREGRIESEIEKNKFIYIEAGDLQMGVRKQQQSYFSFPISHYHGITIGFDLQRAESSLSGVLDGFTPAIAAIKDKFCHDSNPFIMRADTSINHIFSELYHVPERIKYQYMKLKVLELLLFLESLDASSNILERPYFYKVHIEKTKAIMQLLTDNLENHYTLEELSERFDFPLTSMKNCFKGVYGQSIFSYMKSYRIHSAASLLRDTKDSIAVISGKVGYSNPSKFTSAFKSILAQTPKEYRNTFCQNGLFASESSGK